MLLITSKRSLSIIRQYNLFYYFSVSASPWEWFTKRQLSIRIGTKRIAHGEYLHRNQVSNSKSVDVCEAKSMWKPCSMLVFVCAHSLTVTTYRHRFGLSEKNWIFAIWNRRHQRNNRSPLRLLHSFALLGSPVFHSSTLLNIAHALLIALMCCCCCCSYCCTAIFICPFLSLSPFHYSMFVFPLLFKSLHNLDTRRNIFSAFFLFQPKILCCCCC